MQHISKNKIQAEALQSVLDNGGSGLIAICTGGGEDLPLDVERRLE